MPNNPICRPVVSWAVGILLGLSSLGPVWGDNLNTNPYGEKSFQPSIAKESSEAIFGRVFGVQDEKLEIDYMVYELKNHTPVSATTRSAFMPGWGQAFNGQNTKGALLFSMFALATAGSYIRHQQAKHSYDDYLQEGVKDGSKYDDYQTQQTQSYVLGGLALGLWIYGMFDAYQHAYSPLWTQDDGLQLAFVPDAANSVQSKVTWKRRF